MNHAMKNYQHSRHYVLQVIASFRVLVREGRFAKEATEQIKKIQADAARRRAIAYGRLP